MVAFSNSEISLPPVVRTRASFVIQIKRLRRSIRIRTFSGRITFFSAGRSLQTVLQPDHLYVPDRRQSLSQAFCNQPTRVMLHFSHCPSAPLAQKRFRRNPSSSSSKYLRLRPDVIFIFVVNHLRRKSMVQ